MAELSLNSATVGDSTNIITETAINSKMPDEVMNMDETTWINHNFYRWFGIYRMIPEVKIALDMRSVWTIGKGIEADSWTSGILDNITGCGNDTFNLILKNMMVTKRIGGDAFAEIIRDDEGTLINLKPIDPGSMMIVFNRSGQIIRYEQMNSVSKKGGNTKFKPSEIFHLTNKRVCGETHGISYIEAIEEIIKANNESFAINKQIVRNFSRPKMMVEVDSDDLVKIEAFATKFDTATSKGDNLYYPKGTVTPQVLAVSSNATLNLLPWREHLKNYFYQVVGIPQIILGSSGEFTESTAKIAYLAFEQSVDDEQNDIEAQIWNQLYLRVKLTFPTSLKNELISDTKKDGEDQQTSVLMNPAGMEE